MNEISIQMLLEKMRDRNQKKFRESSLGQITDEEFKSRKHQFLESAEQYLAKGDIDNAYIDYMRCLTLSRYETQDDALYFGLNRTKKADDLLYEVIHDISRLGRYDPNPDIMWGDGSAEVIGEQVITERQMISLLEKMYNTVSKSDTLKFSRRALSEIPRNIGDCYASLGDSKMAKKWYLRGLKIDPTNEPLRINYERYGLIKKLTKLFHEDGKENL
jgi:tetratricopeptide (TPR) repeat protein